MSGRPGCGYQDLLGELREEFPSFKLVWKEDSRCMRCISFVLMCLTFGLQRQFQTHYITTIGYTVYLPAGWEKLSDIARMVILRHERVHMRQRRSLTLVGYTLLYVFLPLPGFLAYFRTLFEMEAYEETIQATVELYPNGAALVMTKAAKDQMVANFVGPGYFWMWPFRERIEYWYDHTVARILAGQKKA